VLIDLGLIKRRGTGVTDPIVRIGRGISIIDGKPVGVGTLDYAAPEQLLKGEASVQSDIFALGKILRALYEGRPPHCLKSVIRRATRELPGDRYESANDFAAAIRRRNRPFLVLLAVLSLAGFAILAYPAYRPRLVVLAERFVRGQQPEVQTLAVQKPKETDSDYIRRLTSLAEDGDTASQIALAEAHFYGRGTPTNRMEAVKWYRLAAKAGEASAQASLGLCLLRGWGCERSPVEAVSWYVVAAEQGDLTAMNDLAFCYMHGMGVAKDAETGFAWALKAAERGHAPAQALVGECYLTGRGVAQDPLQAQTWLFRATRQGNRRAKMLLETLAQ
jgi:TPR repeat protein